MPQNVCHAFFPSSHTSHHGSRISLPSTATEDFDEALDRRIRSLAAERELIQVQIAERRSKTPLAIHGLMDDLVRRKLAAEYVPKAVDDGEDEEDELLRSEREPLERKEEVERTLEETLEILGELEQVSPSWRTADYSCRADASLFFSLSRVAGPRQTLPVRTYQNHSLCIACA